MADNNIFVYIFPSNKKWREKCGTFFLILSRSKSFRAKYFSRKMSRGISALTNQNAHIFYARDNAICAQWFFNQSDTQFFYTS